MNTLAQSKEKLTPRELLPVFEELLPVKVIQELVKACKRHFYERLLTPLIMVWGLIYQRLNHDHSCDAAVAHISSGAVSDVEEGSLHISEQAMAKDILSHSVPNSVDVGDCNFGVYSVAQAARHYGIWLVVRRIYRCVY